MSALQSPSDIALEMEGAYAPIILHEMPGCLIKQLSDNTVVKSGSRVTLDERSALDLAARLTLPVPHVYESDSLDGNAWIRMEFVPGKRLDLIWPGMTVDEKDSICRQLREILTIMRSAPWEIRLIGSCSGGTARDCRRYSDYNGGPFPNEAAFNSFYLDLVATVSEPIHTALSRQLRSNHRIVFSHGDLAQHNILVQDGKITALLDWEYAGWYPEYWDYIKFFERPCQHRDWKNRAKEIFPQLYEDELAHHQAIVHWQRP